jgi:hypothetical protein
MTNLVFLLSLAIGSAVPPTPTPQTPPMTSSLPFRLELKEVPTAESSPAIHSFVTVPAGERFLLIGGRTGGMHGFANNSNNFPPARQNRSIYLFDPGAVRSVGSLDVDLLGPALADPLAATNAEACCDGTKCYLIGGYGIDSSTKSMVSFDAVTRFDAVALADQIAKGEKDPAKLRPLFAQGHDPRFKIAGGALRIIGGQFALVFGHQFDGEYKSSLAAYNEAGGMQQRYSEKVRMFPLSNDLAMTSCADFGPFNTDLPFHRRDMNVADRVRPDGTFGLTVYGGVFRAGQFAAHLNAVDIDPVANPNPGLTVMQVGPFLQATNQYECAGFTAYDAKSRTHFTTLFGGMSQYRVETDGTVRLVSDPVDLAKGRIGLQFVDIISTIVRSDDGPTVQYMQSARLPGFLGTSGVFLPSSKIARYTNGVVQLAAIRDRTLIGFIYGGIEATGKYPVDGPTAASRRLFQVWLIPGTAAVVRLPFPP